MAPSSRRQCRDLHGVPAVDAPEGNAEGMDEALGRESASPHPAAAFLKDATSAHTTRKPRRKRYRNRRRRTSVPVLQSAVIGSQCK
ncbi:hypothetical protein MRX96_004152 [Rhipicephalus microplus]